MLILLFAVLVAAASANMGTRAKTGAVAQSDPTLPQVAYLLSPRRTVHSSKPEAYLTRHIIRDHVPKKAFGSFVAHSYAVLDPLHHVSVIPPPLGCTVYSTPGATANFFGGCDVATNGGFFVPESRGEPLGCVGPITSDRRVIQGASKQNVFLGIERLPGGQFQYAAGYAPPEELNSRDWVQLLSGVVWLVKDGVSFVKESLGFDDFSAETSGDGATFASLVAPRLAAGFDRNGSFMLVAVDGSEPDWLGLSLYDLATVLVEMGAYNAINLDGGGSVSVFEGEDVVNVPSDVCPNATAFPRYRCPRAVGSVLCVHGFRSPQTVTKSIKTLRRTTSPSVSVTAEEEPPTGEGSEDSGRLWLFRRSSRFTVLILSAVTVLTLLLTGKAVSAHRRRRYAFEMVQYDTVDCETVGEDGGGNDGSP
jgi:N-acetylglucosamine-1-phosphodiester alpha-N-acetylglucosaminidase